MGKLCLKADTMVSCVVLFIKDAITGKEKAVAYGENAQAFVAGLTSATSVPNNVNPAQEVAVAATAAPQYDLEQLYLYYAKIGGNTGIARARSWGHDTMVKAINKQLGKIGSQAERLIEAVPTVAPSPATPGAPMPFTGKRGPGRPRKNAAPVSLQPSFAPTATAQVARPSFMAPAQAAPKAAAPTFGATRAVPQHPRGQTEILPTAKRGTMDVMTAKNKIKNVWVLDWSNEGAQVFNPAREGTPCVNVGHIAGFTWYVKAADCRGNFIPA